MGESSLDLRGLLKSWMITLRARGKSAETLRAYRIAAELFCEHSDVLTKDAVISWLAGMDGVEPATIRLRLAGVKQFCHWLGQEGYLDPSPILLVKAPKLTHKPVDNLSDEEIERMLRACAGKHWRDKRDRAILVLLAETGLRRGELLALDVADVDLAGCVVTIRKAKGGKSRRVRFSAGAAAAIDCYQRAAGVHDGPLWRGNRGGALSVTGLIHTLGQRADLAGVNHFHCHRLRHSMAVRWMARGGSEGGLMRHAGWASRDMIDRYTATARESLAHSEFDRLGMGLD